MTPEGGRLVLVGGHESAQGRDLERLLDALPGTTVTTAGRPLHNTVTALLAQGGAPVAVLPMTWGRNPVLVADTARTLDWLASGPGAGRLALAAPYGMVDHLVAALRRAATRTASQHPGAGLVLAAPAADPFDDAELHRVAHLVRTHGAGLEVGVACVVTDADLREQVRRVRLLGADEVVVVPASFAAGEPTTDALEGVTWYGPLVPDAAVLQVVRQRAAAAAHALGHGDDGIGAGLLADHDHGYAHSHGPDGDHVHPHGHDHGHPHGHEHHRTHAHATGDQSPALLRGRSG